MRTALLIATLILLAGCTTDTMNDHVILETTHGTIELELLEQQAPNTTKNFRRYVESGFYDGTVFHRVIDGFMIQGGGFTPQGQQKQTREPIELEAGVPNDRSTVAMARTNDPDSATSQFFINTVDNDMLDPAPGNPGYAVFARVVEGMGVVDEISKVETGRKGGHQDWPTEPVIIKQAYLKQ